MINVYVAAFFDVLFGCFNKNSRLIKRSVALSLSKVFTCFKDPFHDVLNKSKTLLTFENALSCVIKH